MKINGLLILWILIFTWGCADEDDESLIILVPNIDLGVAPNQGDGSSLEMVISEPPIRACL